MNQITAGQSLSEEDAALVVAAHLDLLAAQASGVQVLGSSAGQGLVGDAFRTLTSAAVVLTIGEGDTEIQVQLPVDTTPAGASNQNGVLT